MSKKLALAAIILFTLNTMAFSQPGKPVSDSLTSITIKVKGVTCNNDLNTLSANVKELNGVRECTPGKKGPVSEFMITFNHALVSKKDIYQAIENTEGCTDPKDRPYKVKTN
jgi:copper chaperone CopZ